MYKAEKFHIVFERDTCYKKGDILTQGFGTDLIVIVKCPKNVDVGNFKRFVRWITFGIAFRQRIYYVCEIF